MPMPTLDFLLEASGRSLQDMELAARNRAANLSKQLRIEIEAWIEQETAAAVARWMFENREEIIKYARSEIVVEPKRIEPFRREQKRA